MFDGVVAEVRRRRKQFTVYAPAETDLATQFATRNVAVEHRPIAPEAPGPFLAIHDGGEFRGAVGLETLETLLEPPIARPGDLGDLSSGYRALFELLEGTVFAGLNRRQLLATTREIEDRALRAGRGTLRVSFQSLSVFETQAEVYRTLASETDLDVHVYGRPDWDPPAIEGLTFHATDAVEPFWALAFEGEDAGDCALLARDAGDRFEGVWTYDTDLVAEMLAEFAAVG